MAVLVDVSTLMTDWVTGETVHGRQLCTRIMEEWLCDADIIRVVTAGRSRFLDVGRKTRLTPELMALVLAIRDKGCRYPGCHRPGSWCQAHHVKHWRHGGETNLDNLSSAADTTTSSTKTAGTSNSTPPQYSPSKPPTAKSSSATHRLSLDPPMI
jgi:hypothetical protein